MTVFSPGRKRFAFFLLLTAAVIQLGALRWLRTRPLTGPVTGEVLPASVTVSLNSIHEQQLTDLLTSRGTCSLLVIVSTHCYFCRQMRGTWPQQAREWADSVGVPVHSVWLSGEDEETLNTFYEGYDFSGVTLARLPSRPARTLQRLGLVGTPTSYLLDRQGRLRLGVLGDRFPPVPQGQRACQ